MSHKRRGNFPSFYFYSGYIKILSGKTIIIVYYLHFLKKSFAILLLSVYLFNLVGYTLLLRLLQRRNASQTSQMIESGNYSEADLVLIKVPTSFTPVGNRSEYVRCDGEIERDGTHFNYVKCKISNDTLYLLCLRNDDRKKLNDARDKYAKQMGDIPSSAQKGDGANGKKTGISAEYDQQELSFTPHADISIIDSIEHFFTSPLFHTDLDCLLQPPDLSFA